MAGQRPGRAAAYFHRRLCPRPGLNACPTHDPPSPMKQVPKFGIKRRLRKWLDPAVGAPRPAAPRPAAPLPAAAVVPPIDWEARLGREASEWTTARRQAETGP